MGGNARKLGTFHGVVYGLKGFIFDTTGYVWYQQYTHAPQSQSLDVYRHVATSNKLRVKH